MDSCYQQGTSHIYCQDYAAHGEVNGTKYIIISDGCSGAPNSDVGARLLTLSAIESIRLGVFDFQEFGEKTIKRAREAAGILNLNLDCLTATLLVGIFSGESRKIFLWGDGCIVYSQNGTIWSIDVNFPSGAPLYLNYDVNKYKENFPGDMIITNTRNGEHSYKLIQPPSGLDLSNDIFDPDWLVLLSDGALTFPSSSSSSSSSSSLPLELFDFKSFPGQFITRRLRAYLKTERPTDDIAMAGEAWRY